MNIKTKEIVALEVTNEMTGDNRKFPTLVNQALENCEKIEKILADGAYDDKKNFNLLKTKRIMGEHVMATKTQNVFQEIVMKFTFYNMLLNVKM